MVALGLALAQHTAHLGFTESTLDQISGFPSGHGRSLAAHCLAPLLTLTIQLCQLVGCQLAARKSADVMTNSGMPSPSLIEAKSSPCADHSAGLGNFDAGRPPRGAGTRVGSRPGLGSRNGVDHCRGSERVFAAVRAAREITRQFQFLRATAMAHGSGPSSLARVLIEHALPAKPRGPKSQWAGELQLFGYFAETLVD